jgi:hypothetical protein
VPLFTYEWSVAAQLQRPWENGWSELIVGTTIVCDKPRMVFLNWRTNFNDGDATMTHGLDSVDCVQVRNVTRATARGDNIVLAG